MTIDITIGKLKIKSLDRVLKEKLDVWTFTHKDTFNITEFLEVEQCPDANDGCTEKDTIYPNSGYRSGSISALWDFFQTVMPHLFKEMCPIPTNDAQISRIKPFLDEINKLNYGGKEKMHKIRLKWLKFWCSRAVKLYGNDAVIMFS